jgi:DNA-binding MarR family transcriptional regulator
VPHDEALAELESQLLVLARRSRTRTRDLARELHPRLDPTAYALCVLLSLGPPQRVSEIAAALSLDKSTTSRQVDAAERLGLVERRPDPSDARARLVALTPAGQKTVTAQLTREHRRRRDALREWSDHDVAELTRLLRRLSDTAAL